MPVGCTCQCSSHGVFQRTAPPSSNQSVSTPGRACALPSARRCLAKRVPLMSSLTTSAACSTNRPAGLLRPAADHGVRQVADFPCCPAPAPPSRKMKERLQCRRGWSFPLAPYPTKRFPHWQPHCVTTAVALSPFGSLPLSRSTPLAGCLRSIGLGPATSGLCSTSESVALMPRCRDKKARCSLGLRPQALAEASV